MGVGHVPQEPIYPERPSAQLQRRQHRGTSQRRSLNLSRRARGAWAEDLVARHYERLGYMVVARNFHFPGGELDVVAIRGRELVVCEVKARASSSHGSPAESVTRTKQARIRKGAVVYIRNAGLSGMKIRFDVACVLGTELEVITDAF
jgi:putative endonuclease